MKLTDKDKEILFEGSAIVHRKIEDATPETVETIIELVESMPDEMELIDPIKRVIALSVLSYGVAYPEEREHIALLIIKLRIGIEFVTLYTDFMKFKETILPKAN